MASLAICWLLAASGAEATLGLGTTAEPGDHDEKIRVQEAALRDARNEAERWKKRAEEVVPILSLRELAGLRNNSKRKGPARFLAWERYWRHRIALAEYRLDLLTGLKGDDYRRSRLELMDLHLREARRQNRPRGRDLSAMLKRKAVQARKQVLAEAVLHARHIEAKKKADEQLATFSKDPARFASPEVAASWVALSEDFRLPALETLLFVERELRTKGRIEGVREACSFEPGPKGFAAETGLTGREHATGRAVDLGFGQNRSALKLAHFYINYYHPLRRGSESRTSLERREDPEGKTLRVVHVHFPAPPEPIAGR